MDTLEQLRQRVHNATVNLALGMAANGMDEGVLPIDEITVKKTPDGVVVKFVDTPVKRPKLRPKSLDES